MVLSVETTLRHATCGSITLEDTIAVTAGGSERGWTRTGPGPSA